MVYYDICEAAHDHVIVRFARPTRAFSTCVSTRAWVDDRCVHTSRFLTRNHSFTYSLTNSRTRTCAAHWVLGTHLGTIFSKSATKPESATWTHLCLVSKGLNYSLFASSLTVFVIDALSATSREAQLVVLPTAAFSASVGGRNMEVNEKNSLF